MAKQNFKYDRLAESIKFTINNIINEEIDKLNFVSVIEVELTKDLGDAKIYIQCLDDSEIEYSLEILSKLNKFIKKRLAEEVQMRRIPNLIFKYDYSLDNYNHIEELISKANVNDDK